MMDRILMVTIHQIYDERTGGIDGTHPSAKSVCALNLQVEPGLDHDRKTITIADI